MPGVVKDTPARFRYEADLVEPLSSALASLVFAPSSLDQVDTFAEVPAVHGVPDLAAIRFNLSAIAERDADGVRPLATDIEVKTVLAIGRGSTDANELARRLHSNSDYIRRAVLPLLVERGWVEATGSSWRRRKSARAVGVRVVTVEAKLRDWHRALGQARRQRLSADAAYIALDEPTVRRAGDELRQVALGGIGVISVDPITERARVWAAPMRRSLPSDTVVGRMLIAERCLEMRDRGEYSGQIAPVFGWLQPQRAVAALL